MSALYRPASIDQLKQGGIKMSQISPAKFDDMQVAVRFSRRMLSQKLRWCLSYEDLAPYNENSIEGRLFLATNLAFFGAGQSVMMSGSSFAFGALLDLAGTFSIFYHWAQLRYGGSDRPEVQLAICLDYATALPSIFLGGFYALELGPAVPASSVICTIIAFSCLARGWDVKRPEEYLLYHSFWHIFGAASLYTTALAHQPLPSIF